MGLFAGTFYSLGGLSSSRNPCLTILLLNSLFSFLPTWIYCQQPSTLNLELRARSAIQETAQLIEGQNSRYEEIALINAQFLSSLREAELDELLACSHDLIAIQAAWGLLCLNQRSEKPSETGVGSASWFEGYIDGRFCRKFPFQSFSDWIYQKPHVLRNHDFVGNREVKFASGDTISIEFSAIKCIIRNQDQRRSTRWQREIPLWIPYGGVEAPDRLDAELFLKDKSLFVLCMLKHFVVLAEFNAATGQSLGCVVFPSESWRGR